MKALRFLKKQGITNFKSLQGGIDAWAEAVEPNMARD
jgi:rhodanese-related sulfurtransferase